MGTFRISALIPALPLMAAALLTAALAAPLQAGPVAPMLPRDAERIGLRSEIYSTYALPIGPWEDGSMLTRRTEGRVEMSSWHMPDPGSGTLGLLTPLRQALDTAGWRILYECETQSCGGFDFRYSTQVLPEPDMHVDLGDFRFLSARRTTPAGEEVLSLLVSRSAGTGLGYVQAIEVAPAPPEAAPPAQTAETPADSQSTLSSKSALRPEAAALASQLEAGTLVLEGLSFASGSTTLESAGGHQLADLASYLAAHPDRRIALVGHTDASGNLEANVSLSKRRAESVRQRMIQDFAADGTRITALGAGFMAPRAPNLTEEGRAKNRRVEVILTSIK